MNDFMYQVEEIVYYDNFIIILISIISAVTYIVVYSYFYKRYQNNKTKVSDRFSNALIEGIKNKTLETEADIINLYKGLTNLNSEDTKYRYGFSRFLRAFLVRLVSKDAKELQKLKSEDIVHWKKIISNLIAENDKAHPYADLPETERNILTDIEAYLDNDDSKSTKRKIKELGAIILTRHEEYQKIKWRNKWSVPLSIAGLIWTILYGIVTYYYKMR